MHLIRAILVAGFLSCTACAVAAPSGPPESAELYRLIEPKLNEAVKLWERHSELPDRTWFFGPDKRSNKVELDALLDEAIAMLDVSEASDIRRRIRALEEANRASHAAIAEFRNKRVGAPDKDSVGLLESVNPFAKTRQDYDAAITGEQNAIDDRQEEIAELKRDFAVKLKEVGLEVDAETVDALLSSISGDDYVQMSVVFNNVKLVTEQLQQLTEQSGEALEFAKRYYGMFVVLVRLLDRMQEQFVTEIQGQHIPRLKTLMRDAQRNIDQARKLIATKGGDAGILQANIDSNQLTIQAAELHIRYLDEQAEMVARENAEVKRTLATAVNSYETVKVSSEVAAMIKAGQKNFEALMKLKLPYPRQFQNEALRREFERMTRQLQEPEPR